MPGKPLLWPLGLLPARPCNLVRPAAADEQLPLDVACVCEVLGEPGFQGRKRLLGAYGSVAINSAQMYIFQALVSCLVNKFTNLRVFFVIGCVALARVAHATRAGLKPAPTSHRALRTAQIPAWPL